MNFDKLTHKKKRLDGFRPLPDRLVRNLDDWFRVELTYTSNAVAGNTLTRRETALIIDKGLTVGGKSLTEHLAATNHAHALDWVSKQLKRKPSRLTGKDILHIHGVILQGIDDNAGHYRSVPASISGAAIVAPAPRKVPTLMWAFVQWLAQNQGLHPVALAAEAHYRLVRIHPFVAGNGRSARLLMNMILLMRGYPAAIIRKCDRLAYMGALEKARLGGPEDEYLKIIVKAVNRSLDIYLKAAAGGPTEPVVSDKLLKIGALATQVGASNSTIRHWTKQGLLSVADITEAGYQLYAPEMVDRIKQIHRLKERRFTLQEIKEKLA